MLPPLAKEKLAAELRNTQARPNSAAEGGCSWYFGRNTGESVSTAPTIPPANISQSLTASRTGRARWQQRTKYGGGAGAGN